MKQRSSLRVESSCDEYSYSSHSRSSFFSFSFYSDWPYSFLINNNNEIYQQAFSWLSSVLLHLALHFLLLLFFIFLAFPADTDNQFLPLFLFFFFLFFPILSHYFLFCSFLVFYYYFFLFIKIGRWDGRKKIYKHTRTYELNTGTLHTVVLTALSSWNERNLTPVFPLLLLWSLWSFPPLWLHHFFPFLLHIYFFYSFFDLISYFIYYSISYSDSYLIYYIIYHLFPGFFKSCFLFTTSFLVFFSFFLKFLRNFKYFIS